MKRLVFALAASILVFTAAGAQAVVGNIYLTAYDGAKGGQVSAGKFGRQVLLATAPARAGDVKAAKAKRTLRYDEKVALCGTTYYTTKRGLAWVDAHRKAGHVLVVRKHVAARKYDVLCGTVPKRARADRKPAMAPKAKPQ
jgi:hypothetical protein